MLHEDLKCANKLTANVRHWLCDIMTRSRLLLKKQYSLTHSHKQIQRKNMHTKSASDKVEMEWNGMAMEREGIAGVEEE